MTNDFKMTFEMHRCSVSIAASQRLVISEIPGEYLMIGCSRINAFEVLSCPF